MEEETKEEIKPTDNVTFHPIYLERNSITLDDYIPSKPEKEPDKEGKKANDDDRGRKSNLEDIKTNIPPRRTLHTLQSPFYNKSTRKHINTSGELREDTENKLEISTESKLESFSTSSPNPINFVTDDSSSYNQPNDQKKAAMLKTLYSHFKWKKPSWTRLSSFIVRNAPCFWCHCCTSRLDVSATHRSVLLRLNILCGFFATGQVAAGIFLLVVLLLHDNDNFYNFRTNLWNLNCSIFTLGIIGFVLMCCVFFTRNVIRRVNLVGAIRYLWILMWILPLELFLSISLFGEYLCDLALFLFFVSYVCEDYHRVTHVWIRHWWHTGEQ